MSRRTKAILLAVGGAIAILFLVVLIIRSLTPQELPAELPPKLPVTLETIPLVNTSVDIARLPGEDGSVSQGVGSVDTASTDIKSLVSMFSERFGSYSSDSDFESIRDLEVMMTENLVAWTEKYRLALSELYADASQEYYGVSTRSISVKTQLFDEEAEKAEYVVTTQRSEVFGSAVPQIRYQDILLKLVKIGNEWKFDFVQWQ